MKVKVLNFLDSDYGIILDTFVFTEEVDIEEVKEKVEEVFQEEQGQRPYCDIIIELYGHLMLEIVENEKVDW